MRKFKRLTLTLALLLTAVGGAWADETPLLTIESKDNTSFKSGSKTFDDMVTVTFSDEVYNDGDSFGWYAGGSASQLTVSGTNGYTITSCKFYTEHGSAETGYPVEGESPSVYLSAGFVYNDANLSMNIGGDGVKKIEVYGSKSEPTEWSLKPDETGKTWTLAEMPASNIELQVEYEPTKVSLAANDNAMGTVEVAGESKVEWTADTWKGWTANTKEYTVDDITMTISKEASVYEYTVEGTYKNSLSFFVDKWDNTSTVTFSTTGDPFSRIEFTMLDNYEADWNPNIMPTDNWTIEGKSAKWEGEATKSLILQSCTTEVSKITFFKGAAIPDGVTVNTDGTFTVAKTATVTLKATPKEGYKFLYWEDDQSNTNPVREVTIESGMADKTYKAVFAEITYNVTFVEGTNLDEWSATPNTEVTKDTKVDIKYTGTKKVIGVKVEKKVAEPVADIIWDGTNVTDLNVESTYKSYTKEGVKLSGNADQVQVKWNNSEYLGKSGMEFITMESGGFTFTAPTGKKFTKIEMKALGSSGWAQVNLGTGWAYNTGTVTWNGSAASTVKLLKDADMFSGDFISSIAFYLSE